MIRDVKEIQNSNLWQDTRKQIETKPSKQIQITNQEANQNILIVLGDRSAGNIFLRLGKSSFIKIFKNDFDLETKPTHLVDYSLIKRGLDKKEIVHCYEIGESKLIAVIKKLISRDQINLNSQISFCVVIDLSKGKKTIANCL